MPANLIVGVRENARRRHHLHGVAIGSITWLLIWNCPLLFLVIAYGVVMRSDRTIAYRLSTDHLQRLVAGYHADCFGGCQPGTELFLGRPKDRHEHPRPRTLSA